MTAGRSVAVDPQAVPYGTPLWISTTEPLSAGAADADAASACIILEQFLRSLP